MKPNEGTAFAGVSGAFGFKFQNAPVEQLRVMIAAEVKKPVVDQTRLAGNYDFEVKFLRENFRGDLPHPDYPSIFVALPEQLGLRLTTQKVPVDYLVIDHVERAPAEN
jgi:uncharacterized protein (TIGR03435 family)